MSIVDNEIESLEPLRTLTKLTFLKLNNNKIKDLEPLSGLTALATLFLYDNYISDISPLYAVASLKTAGLGGNCILKEQFDELEEKNPDINIGDTPEDFQDPAKCQ
ncbi:MAG TPA: leucine-rich repeat domain-containing protein [bacterium]|nr:leucine-rich repeat domain-containing protein [bacterium]